MTAKKPHADLCITCNQSDKCICREGFKQPVLFCEEFDDAVAVAPVNTGTPITHESGAVCTASMGLCANCETRKSCTLSNTPGGIWHCEEYQ